MIRSILSSLVLLATLASASQLGLMTVKQPLYMHGSDSDPEIQIVDVPVASSGSFPESLFAAIHVPFIPPTDGSWKEPEDVNMTSLYGIRVSVELDSAGDVELWKITVDASKAKKPEDYPFSLAQVIDSTVTCAKVMCPHKPEDERKVTITVVQPKK